MTEQPDRYAVFGNPIAHSKSPQIHTAFASQTGEIIEYTRVLVEPGHFREAAASFFNSGGKGLNITVPFKLDAFAYADERTPRADKAAAVNTLKLMENGNILGDNTDGAGLVADICNNLGWSLASRKVLVLGAGGAVRGILQPVLDKEPALVVVANRTEEKAIELAQEFAGTAIIHGCGFAALASQQFDVVINGTAASLGGELPPLPDTLLAPGAACYDMMYSKDMTVFLHWARDHGAAKMADGLGMLVEQAAESFYLWRNKRPQTAPVIRLLRQQL